MSISYRYLPIDSALDELPNVKLGLVSIQDALEKEDYHLRPFTDSGITTDRLLEIRKNIFSALAVPSEKVSEIRLSFSEFDKLFTRISFEIFHDLNPVDGFNKDVWSYLTMRLLPDLALWRWEKNRTDERFLGGLERSSFQRLWLRAFVIGPELASKLQEDEAVNIFERPEAIGGNKRLALALATYIVDNRGVLDLESGEKIITTDLVKQTAKRLRRTMSVQVVQSMTDQELYTHIESNFRDSLETKKMNN